MASAFDNCNIRQFGCEITDNKKEPFQCSYYAKWSEWSSCPKAHPCAPNQTDQYRKKTRNCQDEFTNGCNIPCVGDDTSDEVCPRGTCPAWSIWAAWSECFDIPHSFEFWFCSYLMPVLMTLWNSNIALIFHWIAMVLHIDYASGENVIRRK